MRTESGFTLIELMVTIAILALLAAIAVPSYQSVVERARRAEARVGLQTAVQGLERCYTRFSAYDNGGCDIAVALEGAGIRTEEGWYLVTGAIDTASYALTATPQGAQTSDTTCGNFTLDQTNARGISGSGTVDNCW